ncbi:MAG: cytochrome c biogenesis protein CcsA [Pirellulaceae bacterium]
MESCPTQPVLPPFGLAAQTVIRDQYNSIGVVSDRGTYTIIIFRPGMAMLSNISIICFASSYAVTLALEVSRPFFRVPVRWAIMIAFAAAGLFAHTVYLWVRVNSAPPNPEITPLSSWYDWCLVVAWVLTITYLGLAIRRPANTIGPFLIPLVLALIAMAYAVHDKPPFGREQALTYWGICHSVLLLLGTVAAAFGFATGSMYLLQSYRLKRALLPRPGFRLPSLEWLQSSNRRSLWLSSCLLTLGLLAGLVLNAIKHSNQTGTISWTDPVVLSSSFLFVWLTFATVFESLYKPAREGHKVAYITLVSFVCLGAVLGLVLWGQHGLSETDNKPSSREEQGKISPETDSLLGSGEMR